MSLFDDLLREYPHWVMVKPDICTDPRFKSWKKEARRRYKDDEVYGIPFTGGRKQARRFVYLIFRTQEKKQEFITEFESFVIQRDPKEIRKEAPRARDLRAPEIF